MKHLSAVLSGIVIVLLILFSFQSLMPSEGTLASTPLTEFSTERALVQLREIAKAPHYHGTKAHNDVREYLVQELNKLGLETQVQAGFMLSGSRRGLIKPKNIVARLKGSGNGKSLVLLSHYDSALVPSLGASDAGSGIVTILESLRAYQASGEQPVNDIIVLFSDAEEIGLDGASLFVKEHPWAKNVGLVLNFEARGSGGPSNMIVETNGGNAKLIEAFEAANVPFPVASSLMYSVYKMLPNDTDSTRFREEGNIESMFFAFIDDHFDYHTANDTVENLDINTLQHQGSYLLPLLHSFAKANLSDLKATEDYVYVNMPIVTFISYPFSWILPLLIAAVLCFIALLVYGISKKAIQLKAVFFGFIPFLGALILCGVLGYYGWQLAETIYPQYSEIQHGFKYNGHWYIIAFVCLSLGITFLMYSWAAKKASAVNLYAAPLFLWLLINAIILAYLKGAGYFIIPVFFGLLSWLILIKWPRVSFIGMVLLAAPALFIFTPLIQFFPVGLGSDHVVISCLFTVLLFGLMLSVFGYYKAKKMLGITSISLGVVFLITAHIKSDFNEHRNKPNSLVYYKNKDIDKAYWLTFDTLLDSWTQTYVGANPEPAENYVPQAAGNKYKNNYKKAAPAPLFDIPDFNIKITQDTLINNERHLGLTILPTRDAHQIELFVNKETAFKTLTFNGVAVKETDSAGQYFYNRKNDHLLRYFITDNDSLHMQFSVPKNNPLPQIKVLEYGFDLLTNPLYGVAPRDKTMTPKPFVNTDATVVQRSIVLDTIKQ